MKAKPFFLPCVSVFLLCASSGFGSYASCNVYAVYENLSQSRMDTSAVLGQPAQEEVLLGIGLEDYSSSWARATLDGKVSGRTEGFSAAGKDVFAHSSSVSSADWLVWSDTLAVGTPVRLWLDVLFEGHLYSEQSDAVSRAWVVLQKDGVAIYSGSAEYNGSGVSAGSQWDGSCFIQDSKTCLLYAPGSLFIDAAVGQRLNLTLHLQTSIECTQTQNGGARTDFSSSGSYQFLGAYSRGMPPRQLDVQVILVPEPLSLVLLLGGAAVNLRRFRL